MLTAVLLVTTGRSQTLIDQIPSAEPSVGQQAQIARKYGMFCHFGINTYANQEWTDGSLPPETYAPPADLDRKIDTWVKTAHDAGMRYFLCITKHHDGFCLWDTKDTGYCAFNPAVKHHIDVVREVSNACKKYGIGFAVYYSLWDRNWDRTHADLYKKDHAAADKAYVDYMVGQLRELMTQYGPVTELWLDGSWAKDAPEWELDRVYDVVKRNQPLCQVGVNWTINSPDNPPHFRLLPADQKDGYPFRYFPSDFRLLDPRLPGCPDPKHFTHNGKSYYLPFEATVTASARDLWFYHANDPHAKSPDQLEDVFETATAQDNMLVLNIPPDREGNLVPEQVASVMELAKRLGIEGGGKPFPKPFVNLCFGAKAETSATWNDPNDPDGYSASKAIDGNPGTRWACAAGVTAATLDIDFGKPVQFNRIDIEEFLSRTKSFDLEIPDPNGWKVIYTGTEIGNRKDIQVNETTASKLRLNIKQASEPPSIFEIIVSDR